MKYVQVVQWSAERDGIRFEMLGDDQELHRFEVSAECAGALGAALAAEAEKLNGEGNQQFIRPTGMQTGRTEQGEPVLFLSLDGGTELPLVFKPESIGLILSELEGLMRAVQPGSQVRWR
ncbi:hypothetical protein [Sphingomonas sp.]|uniref:hypothetical protein n=1 Tax=Sphingomonas sp. TaxID=28214 RepID=UPI002E35E88D|nr:hypothetical protein [Sphingomonas sp.]HEX4692913.1 hypothetical protein [Sphingomonas sp.]